VSGNTTTTLWVAEGNKVRLSVAPPPGGELPVLSDALFVVTGDATPVRGNFASPPTITPGGSGEVHGVNVGIDMDGSETLELSGPAAEVTHSLVIRVINCAGSQVQAQRISDGPAEALFPIKSGEHFEIGGTFHFELTGGGIGPHSMIRYELRDTDGRPKRCQEPFLAFLPCFRAFDHKRFLTPFLRSFSALFSALQRPPLRR
jgi:hypothetical protein